MPALEWFHTHNRTRLHDAEFLANVGITIQDPSGDIIYLRDDDTGRTVGLLGVGFVMTDGRVKLRPRHGVGDFGLTKLLQIGVDCVERELHLRERWTYHRKTSKRPGYWMSYLYAGIDVSDEEARGIEALYTAMQSPDEARNFGIGESHTLNPVKEGAQ